MEPLRTALTAAGRSMTDMEIVGGLRPAFSDPHSPANIDQALQSVAWQLEQGYTSVCSNPSQYVDDVAAVPALCQHPVRRLNEV